MMAKCLLETLGRPYTRLNLEECEFEKVDEAFLNRRDRLLKEEKFEDPLFDYARQFRDANEIVIAAPYYDLSFPARLKMYLEQINVVGITFRYTEEGIPVGLCKAKKLYYVTTAGGEFFPAEYGFGYVEALCKNFYGIEEVELIKAIGLDIVGARVEQILDECRRQIKEKFGRKS